MSSLMNLVDLIKLDVSVYHNARVCGQWTIREHSEGNTCFHMATQGNCQLTIPGQGSWTLSEGDLVLFPREIPHSMVSEKTLSGPQQHLLIADSQHIPGTSMLCGEIRFRHLGSEPLLNALPPVLLIKKDGTTPWLCGLYTLIVEESLICRQQTNPILNRLCELLFSYALRHYAENDGHSAGILSLFANKQIVKAVEAIHAEPSRAWGLLDLAEYAAMSRTQFAQTFKKTSGWTPMQYLAWWRMQLAWSILQAGESVAATAEQVGYQSEAAFSRAFRKEFGESAGSVRRSRLA